MQNMYVFYSFHGTVFSILLHKQFTVIDGMGDVRSSTLLKSVGLTGRSWDTETVLDIGKCLENIDYTEVDKKIENLKLSGMEYLEKALKTDKKKKDNTNATDM